MPASLIDGRIIALGEATHGTREFFQLKHRFLRYLVERGPGSSLSKRTRPRRWRQTTPSSTARATTRRPPHRATASLLYRGDLR
ncbi:hypothetical protein [Halovenus salina]|uniref:Erythromycin esterase n=1 Tax=Halovenus salina TaxID=1510225 RepID=A0ABD5W2X7_9EURY